MNPSYDNSFGSLEPGGTGPAGFDAHSFGSSNGFGSSPSSFGTGDIILGGSEPKKKSKKKIAIIITLVIVLMLAVGGLLLWQSGMFGANNNTYKPATDLTAKLRTVINYMFSGEQSEDVLEQIPDDAQFKFEEVFYSDNNTEKAAYFETANNLQYDAMDTLLGDEEGAMSEYNALMTSIQSSLYTVSSVAMVDDLSIEDLRNGYTDPASVSELKKEVRERYEDLLSSEDEDLEYYGQAYVDFLEMRIDEYELIAQNDCLGHATRLEDYSGLESCPNLNNFTSNFEEIEGRKGKLGLTPKQEKNRADNMILSDIDNLVENYKRLNTELNK